MLTGHLGFQKYWEKKEAQLKKEVFFRYFKITKNLGSTFDMTDHISY